MADGNHDIGVQHPSKLRTLADMRHSILASDIYRDRLLHTAIEAHDGLDGKWRTICTGPTQNRPATAN
jgi:hypothetical protein